MLVVSGVQQSDSVMHTHIHTYTYIRIYIFFSRFFFIIVYCKILSNIEHSNTVLYSRTLLFIYFTYIIYLCVSVNPTLLIYPSPHPFPFGNRNFVFCVCGSISQTDFFFFFFFFFKADCTLLWLDQYSGVSCLPSKTAGAAAMELQDPNGVLTSICSVFFRCAESTVLSFEVFLEGTWGDFSRIDGTPFVVLQCFHHEALISLCTSPRPTPLFPSLSLLPPPIPRRRSRNQVQT